MAKNKDLMKLTGTIIKCLPGAKFIVKADDVYNTEAYNGRYILTRKRELYIREDENFSMNTMLLFEKVTSA